jgi:hypothetical protein
LATSRGVSGHNSTSLGVASISSAHGVGSNRVSNVQASLDGVTRIRITLVSKLATCRGISRNNSTSCGVTLVRSTLSVRSHGVSNMCASLDGVTSISEALIIHVATTRGVSGYSGTSLGVASVRSTLSVGSDGVGNMLASLDRVAAVSVAHVSLVASARCVSDTTVVLAIIGGINNTLDSVASGFASAVSINLASNFAGAKIGVDLKTSCGITSVTSTSGVGLNRVSNLGASTLASVSGLVAIVSVAQISSLTLGRSRRRDDGALAARTSDGRGKANVACIAAIRGNTVTLAIAKTAARSIASGSRNRLTSLLDEASDERGQFGPITSGKDLRRLVLSDDEKLRIGIDSTDTNCVDENARNKILRIGNSSFEIVVEISNTKGLGLIFVTGNSINILVNVTIHFTTSISDGRLGRADEERMDNFVVITIGQHN